MSPSLSQHLPHIVSTLSNSICTLGNYGVISVSGDDARKFLQGQVTCDVDAISNEHASLGAFCNVQGRMHATFYLAQFGEQLLMVMPKEVIENTLKKLSMYAVFFQAELSDASDAFQLQGLFGDVHLDTQSSEKQSGNFALTVTKQDQHVYIALADSQVQLVISPSDVAPLEHLDAHQNKSVASHDYWSAIEILLSIPMVFAPTIEELLPHFVGLTQVNGVGFEKGCYTGQEVIARMHYRGTLKTHSAILFSDTANDMTNTIGKTVFAQIADDSDPTNITLKKAGQVTNSITIELSSNDQNPSQFTLALISLSDKYAQNSTFTISEQTLHLSQQ